jgi:hypothetical protein
MLLAHQAQMVNGIHRQEANSQAWLGETALPYARVTCTSQAEEAVGWAIL